MDGVIYVGTGNHVAAIDRRDGKLLWKTALRRAFFKAGHDFVTLLVVREVVYAHTYGRLYALRADTGHVLWENRLEGLGCGLASLALEGRTASPREAALIDFEERSSDGGD